MGRSIHGHGADLLRIPRGSDNVWTVDFANSKACDSAVVGGSAVHVRPSVGVPTVTDSTARVQVLRELGYGPLQPFAALTQQAQGHAHVSLQAIYLPHTDPQSARLGRPELVKGGSR